MQSPLQAPNPHPQNIKHLSDPCPPKPAHERYDDGLCHAIGAAHSGAVSCLVVSPDKSRVVSVGAEGGIFVWAYAAPPPAAGA
jgi:hypothetical protein